jgi:hypothetical protein
MDHTVRTSSGAVAVVGVQLRPPPHGSRSVNGMIIGLILVPRIKNVDIILKLFGTAQKELGVLGWIVFVEGEFSCLATMILLGIILEKSLIECVS